MIYVLKLTFSFTNLISVILIHDKQTEEQVHGSLDGTSSSYEFSEIDSSGYRVDNKLVALEIQEHFDL